jgi:hypothetical protein
MPYSHFLPHDAAFLRQLLVLHKIAQPGRSRALQPRSPLRTVHDSFHSYSSGPYKAAIRHVATRSLRQSDRPCLNILSYSYG